MDFDFIDSSIDSAEKTVCTEPRHNERLEELIMKFKLYPYVMSARGKVSETV